MIHEISCFFCEVLGTGVTGAAGGGQSVVVVRMGALEGGFSCGSIWLFTDHPLVPISRIHSSMIPRVG